MIKAIGKASACAVMLVGVILALLGELMAGACVAACALLMYVSADNWR